MDLEKLISYVEYKQNEKFSGLPIFIDEWKDELGVLAKGDYYLITSGVSVGKTTFTLDKFVFDQINWLIKNPDSGLDCFYTYFSLEETKVRLELRILSRFVYDATGIEYSYSQLINKNGKSEVDIEVLKQAKQHVEIFNRFVEIVDHCKTPTEIRDKIQHTIDTKLKDKIKLSNFYYPIIIDNLKFVEDEGTDDEKKTIDKLALKYMLDFRNKYQIIPIIIQHQNSSSETPLFDWKKNIVVDSIKPKETTLSGSTDTKTPATHIIGIFDPYKYGIPEYPLINSYDLTLWKNRIRFITLCKARDGFPDKQDLALYFDGKIGTFTVLPPAEEFKKNPNLYKNYKIIPVNNIPAWRKDLQEKLDL